MKEDKPLLKAFIQTHPADAARILESLPSEETSSFLGELFPTLSAEILKHLDPVTASLCLEKLNLTQSVEIIIRLPLDIASHLLRRIEEQQRKAILSKLPPQVSKQVSSNIRNRDGTAGALMDTQVLTLPDDITIKEALKRARIYSDHQAHYIYILNRELLLVGFVTTPQLLAARPSDPLASVMAKPISRLSPIMNRQAILANPGWKELHALPVVDGNGVFLGALGYQTLQKLKMTDEIQPRWQEKGIASAFGELYWNGLSVCINEMILAMRSGRTRQTSPKKR